MNKSLNRIKDKHLTHRTLGGDRVAQKNHLLPMQTMLGFHSIEKGDFVHLRRRKKHPAPVTWISTPRGFHGNHNPLPVTVFNPPAPGPGMASTKSKSAPPPLRVVQKQNTSGIQPISRRRSSVRPLSTRALSFSSLPVPAHMSAPPPAVNVIPSHGKPQPAMPVTNAPTFVASSSSNGNLDLNNHNHDSSKTLIQGQLQQLQQDQTKLVTLVSAMWDSFVQSQTSTAGTGKEAKATVVHPSHSTTATAQELVRKCQTRMDRLERDLNDLQQKYHLLANEKQEDTAQLSNMLAEMSSLKQRLSKTLSQASDQLAHMAQASIPAKMQKDISQLLVESHWLYATVRANPTLPYFASPSFVNQPVNLYRFGQRILVLYKTVENAEGLWMQTRTGADPDKRFWVRVTDDEGNVTLDHFDIIP